MDFDQILRLVAIGVGVVLIILAIVVAMVADEGGCLMLILILAGIAFMVYGFTGDSSPLTKNWGMSP